MRVLMSPANMGPDGNPYIEQLCQAVTDLGVDVTAFTRRRLLDRYEIVHVHWPEHLISWESRRRCMVDVLKIIGLLAIARRRGATLVWTAHDLGPHDKPYPLIYRLYEYCFTRQVDRVITLTKSAIPVLLRAFPNISKTPIDVVPHGDYRNVYPSRGLSRTEAKKMFGVPADKKLVVIFGQLRRYKQIENAMQIFVNGEVDAHLLIIGEPKDSEYLAQLQSVAGTSDKITLEARMVGTPEVAQVVTAADVLYAAYAEGTSLNSGALFLGLSFGRPVIVRNTEVMKELRSTFGDKWIHTVDPGDEASALALVLGSAFNETALPDLRYANWTEIAEKTVDGYKQHAKPDAPKSSLSGALR